MGQSHWVHCEKGPAAVVLPLPAEEVQPATGAAETVYSAIIESVLCTSITIWFSSATKSDLRRLRRVVRTAERIIGTTLPTLQELYSSRVSKRAGKITVDPSHPAHSLFELLPSGRRYRALSTRMTRHRNSFFPQEVISWTLDNNVEHTTLFTLFIHHHTYISFQFAISDLYTHNVYIYMCFCFFLNCLFVYFVYYSLLSVSCPVAVILLHCGASVTITNSSYV